ncbi:MAG: hypothetical protein CVV25_09795 [Ignavibacteriae bacterium HGW-Ignavibacteriae-4]|jgi:uncharacterized membrane protein YkvA (DUF1232 family)|nr:MAG: hypothetical protein CVV25_09795 [Ignavibacteriae bacterium HGW-Ignavibacteriae-4]
MANEDYSKEYSEQSFWGKIKGFAKVAGIKVVYVALILYYTLQDPNVPKKAKAIIIGALGYFILPIDLVPDLIPVAGYSDDFAMLFWALLQVMTHINRGIRAKAKQQLTEWFGNIDFQDIHDIDYKLDNPDDDPKLSL